MRRKKVKIGNQEVSLKLLFAGIAMNAAGFGLLETPFATKDSSLLAKICGVIFGALLLFAGWTVLIMEFKVVKEGIREKKDELKKSLENAETEPMDRLSKFRKDYALFLQSGSQQENPEVQNDVTQIYENILELRRRRLSSLNVRFAFKSIRTSHSKFLPPVDSVHFSDGKYEIEDVKEDIAATSEYFKNEKLLYSKTDNDIAHYTIASARHISANEIACPNCGATQTKEQLLDGCDYCKTKFMVEDLSEKITDFALRRDYELQYARYKSVRKRFTPYVGFGTEAVVCVFYIIYLLFNFKNLTAEMETGILAYLSIGLFTAIIAAIPFAFIAIAIFNTFIFPFIQLGASLNYVSNKILDKQKKAESNNRRMQDLVKNTDPNFSISAFYSNIQNKLATVFFAETNAQINAFAVSDLSGLKEKYKNVIDFETEYICMKDYSVKDNLQRARLEVAVKLVLLDGDKSSVKKENLEMLVTKSADCKTQVVCPPSLLICKGCGASLSLLEGKKCSYCGNEIDLEKHDWVIREYKEIGE